MWNHVDILASRAVPQRKISESLARERQNVRSREDAMTPASGIPAQLPAGAGGRIWDECSEVPRIIEVGDPGDAELRRHPVSRYMSLPRIRARNDGIEGRCSSMQLPSLTDHRRRPCGPLRRAIAEAQTTSRAQGRSRRIRDVHGDRREGFPAWRRIDSVARRHAMAANDRNVDAGVEQCRSKLPTAERLRVGERNEYRTDDEQSHRKEATLRQHGR